MGIFHKHKKTEDQAAKHSSPPGYTIANDKESSGKKNSTGEPTTTRKRDNVLDAEKPGSGPSTAAAAVAAGGPNSSSTERNATSGKTQGTAAGNVPGTQIPNQKATSNPLGSTETQPNITANRGALHNQQGVVGATPPTGSTGRNTQYDQPSGSYGNQHQNQQGSNKSSLPASVGAAGAAVAGAVGLGGTSNSKNQSSGSHGNDNYSSTATANRNPVTNALNSKAGSGADHSTGYEKQWSGVRDDQAAFGNDAHAGSKGQLHVGELGDAGAGAGAGLTGAAAAAYYANKEKYQHGSGEKSSDTYGSDKYSGDKYASDKHSSDKYGSDKHSSGKYGSTHGSTGNTGKEAGAGLTGAAATAYYANKEKYQQGSGTDNKGVGNTSSNDTHDSHAGRDTAGGAGLTGAAAAAYYANKDKYQQGSGSDTYGNESGVYDSTTGHTDRHTGRDTGLTGTAAAAYNSNKEKYQHDSTIHHPSHSENAYTSAQPGSNPTAGAAGYGSTNTSHGHPTGATGSYDSENNRYSNQVASHGAGSNVSQQHAKTAAYNNTPAVAGTALLTGVAGAAGALIGATGKALGFDDETNSRGIDDDTYASQGTRTTGTAGTAGTGFKRHGLKHSNSSSSSSSSDDESRTHRHGKNAGIGGAGAVAGAGGAYEAGRHAAQHDRAANYHHNKDAGYGGLHESAFNKNIADSDEFAKLNAPGSGVTGGGFAGTTGTGKVREAHPHSKHGVDYVEGDDYYGQDRYADPSQSKHKSGTTNNQGHPVAKAAGTAGAAVGAGAAALGLSGDKNDHKGNYDDQYASNYGGKHTGQHSTTGKHSTTTGYGNQRSADVSGYERDPTQSKHKAEYAGTTNNQSHPVAKAAGTAGAAVGAGAAALGLSGDKNDHRGNYDDKHATGYGDKQYGTGYGDKHATGYDDKHATGYGSGYEKDPTQSKHKAEYAGTNNQSHPVAKAAGTAGAAVGAGAAALGLSGDKNDHQYDSGYGNQHGAGAGKHSTVTGYGTQRSADIAGYEKDPTQTRHKAEYAGTTNKQSHPVSKVAGTAGAAAGAGAAALGLSDKSGKNFNYDDSTRSGYGDKHGAGYGDNTRSDYSKHNAEYSGVGTGGYGHGAAGKLDPKNQKGYETVDKQGHPVAKAAGTAGAAVGAGAAALGLSGDKNDHRGNYSDKHATGYGDKQYGTGYGDKHGTGYGDKHGTGYGDKHGTSYGSGYEKDPTQSKHKAEYAGTTNNQGHPVAKAAGTAGAAVGAGAAALGLSEKNSGKHAGANETAGYREPTASKQNTTTGTAYDKHAKDKHAKHDKHSKYDKSKGHTDYADYGKHHEAPAKHTVVGAGHQHGYDDGKYVSNINSTPGVGQHSADYGLTNNTGTAYVAHNRVPPNVPASAVNTGGAGDSTLKDSAGYGGTQEPHHRGIGATAAGVGAAGVGAAGAGASSSHKDKKDTDKQPRTVTYGNEGPVNTNTDPNTATTKEGYPNTGRSSAGGPGITGAAVGSPGAAAGAAGASGSGSGSGKSDFKLLRVFKDSKEGIDKDAVAGNRKGAAVGGAAVAGAGTTYHNHNAKQANVSDPYGSKNTTQKPGYNEYSESSGNPYANTAGAGGAGLKHRNSSSSSSSASSSDYEDNKLSKKDKAAGVAGAAGAAYAANKNKKQYGTTAPGNTPAGGGKPADTTTKPNTEQSSSRHEGAYNSSDKRIINPYTGASAYPPNSAHHNTAGTTGANDTSSGAKSGHHEGSHKGAKGVAAGAAAAVGALAGKSDKHQDNAKHSKGAYPDDAKHTSGGTRGDGYSDAGATRGAGYSDAGATRGAGYSDAGAGHPESSANRGTTGYAEPKHSTGYPDTKGATKGATGYPDTSKGATGYPDTVPRKGHPNAYGVSNVPTSTKLERNTAAGYPTEETRQRDHHHLATGQTGQTGNHHLATGVGAAGVGAAGAGAAHHYGSKEGEGAHYPQQQDTSGVAATDARGGQNDTSFPKSKGIIDSVFGSVFGSKNDTIPGTPAPLNAAKADQSHNAPYQAHSGHAPSADTAGHHGAATAGLAGAGAGAGLGSAAGTHSGNAKGHKHTGSLSDETYDNSHDGGYTYSKSNQGYGHGDESQIPGSYNYGSGGSSVPKGLKEVGANTTPQRGEELWYDTETGKKYISRT